MQKCTSEITVKTNLQTGGKYTVFQKGKNFFYADCSYVPYYMEVDLEPKPYKNFITRCDECKKANGYKICVELNNSNTPNLLDRIKCQELFPNAYPKIKFS